MLRSTLWKSTRYTRFQRAGIVASTELLLPMYALCASPEWETLGFGEKNAADAKSLGLTELTKDMILEPEKYNHYGFTYDLRMDVATGRFILDYESMEYDLAK